MANNLTAEQLIDAMKSMNDTFVKTKKENAKLVKANESQVKYIQLLEEELLQLRIDNIFYESMFQEEKTPTPNIPKPHPLEMKMKSKHHSVK